MKHTFTLLALLFLALLGSCSDNDNENVVPATNQTVVWQDSSAYTGELSVRVIDARSNLITNADVWLYASYADYQNQLDLLYLRTDNQGMAYFGFVNFDNYYLEARATIQDTTKQTVDVVQVRSRQFVEKTLVIQ